MYQQEYNKRIDSVTENGSGNERKRMKIMLSAHGVCIKTAIYTCCMCTNQLYMQGIPANDIDPL